MKKPGVIVSLLQSINREVVHRSVVRDAKGRNVERVWRSASIDDVLSRAEQLLVRGMVSSKVDGWSSSTPGNGSPGGGKGGGRQMATPGDGGVVDWVPTSSTEAAALDSRVIPDPMGMLAARAWRHLQTISAEVAKLEAALDRAERLHGSSLVPDAPMCAVAVMYALPWDDEWSVREGRQARLTDFGQLDEPLPHRQLVCRYAYKFADNHKRMPTRVEMLGHLEQLAVRSTR